MVEPSEPLTEVRSSEIVGRIQPSTAAETLDSPMWNLHAMVEDPDTGRPRTLLKHVRHPQFLIVEEPGQTTARAEEHSPADPEDRPGPWPDA